MVQGPTLLPLETAPAPRTTTHACTVSGPPRACPPCPPCPKNMSSHLPFHAFICRHQSAVGPLPQGLPMTVSTRSLHPEPQDNTAVACPSSCWGVGRCWAWKWADGAYTSRRLLQRTLGLWSRGWACLLKRKPPNPGPQLWTDGAPTIHHPTAVSHGAVV